MRQRFQPLPGVLAVCVLSSVSGLWMLYAQPKQAPNSHFTGNTTKLGDDPPGMIAHIRFDPGARTIWHSHGIGQIVLDEEGVCLTQVKGGPVVEMHAGDTTYVGAGVVHWHGAAPNQGCVQYNVTRGPITWLGEVTEQEYRTPPAKR
jgi:quercetin dioxygenase-like cupin family protein